MDVPRERILVIDDDRELCELLTEYLTPEGFDIESAFDGETGTGKALTGLYSLVVLDVMLPGSHDGFTVLQRIRAGTGTPVLMLSARGDDVDRIVGLETGADDYLSKPFNPRELLARIRAVLRRSRSRSGGLPHRSDTGWLKVGDLELDCGLRVARRKNETVDLTGMEFDVLELLLKNAGRVVPREELASEVLGRDLSPYDRSIDVHISKLRKKLGRETNGAPRIKAVRGTGYIYLVPSSPPADSEETQNIAVSAEKHHGQN